MSGSEGLRAITWYKAHVGDLFMFKGDVGSMESKFCTWWGICYGCRSDDASDKGGM